MREKGTEKALGATHAHCVLGSACNEEKMGRGEGGRPVTAEVETTEHTVDHEPAGREER